MIASPGELLRRHGLHARHSWGQNFLHAIGVHEAIARASGAGPGTRVVEIGAGLGTLTDRLLATGAEVWAIERDRDLCEVLRVELAGRQNFVLHESDAVKFNYAEAAVGQATPPAIVGNLPYQLTGPLLFALLRYHAVTGTWVVMVQKEVAERLCAAPGSRDYGGVTAVLSRVRAISAVCPVSRGCFLPPPRVHPRGLVRLLKGQPAKLNLIPFNPFPGTEYRRSGAAAIAAFRDELLSHGVLATIRRTRGDDIDAACGQLAGRVQDRTTVRLGSKLTSVAVST